MSKLQHNIFFQVALTEFRTFQLFVFDLLEYLKYNFKVH